MVTARKSKIEALKKAKIETSSSDEPSMNEEMAIILKYLNNQNRPYNTNDISNNLHNAVGKTSVQKHLNALVEKNLITGKTFGKQTIYFANQENLESLSMDQLAKMDLMINEKKQLLQSDKTKLSQLQSQLSLLANAMDVETLKIKIKEFNCDHEKMWKKLESLKGTGKVDPKEKEQVDKLHSKYHSLWKERKKKFKEIIDTMTENLPQSPKAFMDELGLEDDPIPITKK